MEKQHNRGQDGAGIATVKLNVEPGYPYMHRVRSSEPQAIAALFKNIAAEVNDLTKYNPDITNHAGLMKGHVKFLGELLMGHLRYGTQGKNNVEFCHPFIKRHTIPARNLALAGNPTQRPVISSEGRLCLQPDPRFDTRTIPLPH